MPPGNRATATAPICGERKNMKVKRIIMMVLAGMLIASGLGHSQNNKVSKTADSELIDAVAALDNKQYKEAKDRLEKITETAPGNDAAFYYLGMCRLYLNDLSGAKASFKKASELDPSNFWYKERLARTYSLSGEDDLTIATYEELLKDFPKKNDIYFTLVNLYLKQNQYDKALGAMDQIENVFGKSENVTATRYDILLRQNKPEEALKTLVDYNKVNQFIADEETEVQTKTQYLDMLVRRSDPRFIQNVKPRIDTLYENLVLVHPTDSAALTAAGLYWYSTERVDKAKELLRKNMTLYPESLGATATYVQLLGLQKDWDALDIACDSALVRFPKETSFLDMKNVSCYNRKDWQGIIDNNKRIIEMAQGDTSVTIPALASIGDMYHELGNEKEAFKVYSQVLKINPDYAPALNNYAYYLALKGSKLKKACAMSKKTIEKEPDNPTYLDTYGWILHLLGRDQEAKTQFKHAMLYGAKESVTSLEHYAVVLEALGETDLAKVYRTLAENRKAEGKE